MRRMMTLAFVSMFAVAGCTPPESVKPPAAPAKGSSGTTSAAVEAPKAGNSVEVKTVSLSVPTMSCPHSCWPEVKKTLESQAGVAAVELAPQAKEGEINDRTVLIKTSAGFELDKAIAALDKAGFDGAAAK